MPIPTDAARLAEQLHSTVIRLLRSVRRADELSGTTASRLSALSVVIFQGPVTLGDLARAEQVRPPTMTRIVTALEEQGLVIRSADTNDARVIRITATTKGKRLLVQGRAHRVRLLRAAVEALSAAERRKIAEALPILQQLL